MKCIIVDDEPLAHIVINTYADKLSFLHIEKECYSASEAINYLHEHEVDLIFLDINMPELQGLDFLRTLENPPFVIITTAYQEYAIEGYELNVMDYLLKPFSYGRFLKAVQKVADQKKLLETSVKEILGNEVAENSTSPQHQVSSIFIKGDKKIHQIQLDDILYLESLGSYVKVHTERETITTLDRLMNLENKLPSKWFLRIHKSYIIALKHVRSIQGNRLQIGEVVIPIGNVYKRNLYDAMK
ncbi:LytR/AlgR family response regulator transcription factor [Spongiimicrobium salis]|uniref:LytR/AlgR family response regulator transcription factor n=1 Tax=Spongiimicrobium salis TaxID=1667022 RepID=UPI00374D5B5F